MVDTNKKYIVLIGETGVGKSNLAKLLSGCDVEVGNKPSGVTKKITAYQSKHMQV